MTADLHYLELTDVGARIKSGELSPVTATKAQLERIAAHDGVLASYALVTADIAMAQAQAAEVEIARATIVGRSTVCPLR